MRNAANTPARSSVQAIPIIGILVALLLVPAAAGGEKPGPKPPKDLTLQAASAVSLTLRWSEAEARGGKSIAGYRLFADGVHAGSTQPTTTRFEFVSLRCGRTYTLGVIAVDDADALSELASITASTAACAADTTAPTSPTNLSQTGATDSGIAVSWTASTDDTGVAGYSLSVGGAETGTTSATSHTFGGLSCGSTYTLGVAAFDSAGNRSGVATVAATTASCPEPSPSAAPAPAGTLSFSAEADARVAEASPTSNYGGSGYLRVDAGDDPDVQSYIRFAVTGVSGAVTSARLRLYATSGSPNGPAVFATSNAWSERGVTWETRPAPVGAASDDVGRVSSATWVEWDVTKLVRGDGSYSFVLVGESSDGVNFTSRDDGPAPQLVVAGGSSTGGSADTKPPTAPSQLQATSATSSSIGLTWTVSVDDVGVAGYHVYRNGVRIGSTSSTGYTVAGLTCETAYSLSVQAYDAAGNLSPQTSVSARTGACAALATTGDCDRVAAPNGSDSGSGTLASPFRTPQRLADALTSGQTGCLRGGSYTVSSGYVLRVGHGGSAGAPITIRSYPGERAKLVGIVSVPNGSDHVVLAKLGIEGTGGSNTVKIYAADVVVEDSELTNAGRGKSCMIIGSNSGYGQAIRTVVQRNRFHDCGSLANGNQDHGIYAQNIVDGKIVGNLFWNSAAYAIQLYPNARRTLFARNVIDGAAPSVRGGVLFGGDGSYASSDNLVEYNVIAYAETYNITSTWSGAVGSGNVAHANCTWAGQLGNVNTSKGGFTAVSNVVADPLFVNRSNRDYRLAATSVCVAVVGFDAVAALLS